MAIFTKSAFRYGWIITDNNNYIDINEGSGEVNIELNVGSYTPATLVNELSAKLNTFLANDYTVSFDRDTRIFTITEAGANNFDLPFATGTNFTRSAASVIGFNAFDLSGQSSYTGSNTTGSEFRPQFKLQGYVPFEDYVEANYSTVTESASGVVQVVKYGDRQFMECNIKYIVDKDILDCSNANPIEGDANALANARSFFDYATTKGDIEFIPDRDNVNEFETVILESTRISRDGTGYKLQPMRQFYGYRETGALKFRKVQ